MKTLRALSRGLPSLFLSSLVLCLASGLVLAFHYVPFGDVFQNVEEITAIMPYGFFFRRLHFYSGQACLVLALAHVFEHAMRGSYRHVAWKKWMRLTAGGAVCLGLVFTGTILAGDLQGVAAGTICRGILRDIPLTGAWVAPLVIGSGDTFFFAPYLLHCVVFPLVLLYSLRGHVRRNPLKDKGLRGIAMATFFLGALALCFSLPHALPPEAAIEEVLGPWFILGLQELLHHFPPLLAGVGIPLALAGVFLVLPILRGKPEMIARWCLGLALCAYVFLGLKLVFA